MFIVQKSRVIRLVLDNLNIHNPAALYEVFEPQEARRIIQKLEFHYTPKHASWLNQVEIELSVLSRQCLERRIPEVQILKSVHSHLGEKPKSRTGKCKLAF